MMRVLIVLVAVVFMFVFVGAIVYCDKNENNFIGVTEIGWRPVVSPKIELEKASGVAYVLVSISYQTNDVTSYHECYLNQNSVAVSHRKNPTTGVWEVYVVAREVKYPTPHQRYFAMQRARDLRKTGE